MTGKYTFGKYNIANSLSATWHEIEAIFYYFHYDLMEVKPLEPQVLHYDVSCRYE